MVLYTMCVYECQFFCILSLIPFVRYIISVRQLYLNITNQHIRQIYFYYYFSYILSLALADLLLIVTSVPFVSLIYTLESWPWGSTICTMSEFVKDVSIGVSVFTLTALSSDRFFAIVDPLRKFQGHGKFSIIFIYALIFFGRMLHKV